MNGIVIVDNHLIQEVDNLAKETGLPFRDLLEAMVLAYLSDRSFPNGEDLSHTPTEEINGQPIRR